MNAQTERERRVSIFNGREPTREDFELDKLTCKPLDDARLIFNISDTEALSRYKMGIYYGVPLPGTSGIPSTNAENWYMMFYPIIRKDETAQMVMLSSIQKLEDIIDTLDPDDDDFFVALKKLKVLRKYYKERYEQNTTSAIDDDSDDDSDDDPDDDPTLPRRNMREGETYDLGYGTQINDCTIVCHPVTIPSLPQPQTKPIVKITQSLESRMKEHVEQFTTTPFSEIIGFVDRNKPELSEISKTIVWDSYDGSNYTTSSQRDCRSGWGGYAVSPYITGENFALSCSHKLLCDIIKTFQNIYTLYEYTNPSKLNQLYSVSVMAILHVLSS